MKDRLDWAAVGAYAGMLVFVVGVWAGVSAFMVWLLP